MPTLPFQTLPPNSSQRPGQGPRTHLSPGAGGGQPESQGSVPSQPSPALPHLYVGWAPETCFPGKGEGKGEGTEAPEQGARSPSRRPPELPSTHVPWGSGTAAGSPPHISRPRQTLAPPSTCWASPRATWSLLQDHAWTAGTRGWVGGCSEHQLSGCLPRISDSQDVRAAGAGPGGG